MEVGVIWNPLQKEKNMIKIHCTKIILIKFLNGVWGEGPFQLSLEAAEDMT